MSRLSIMQIQLRSAEWVVAAFAVLLCASCSGPSVKGDRVAVAAQPVTGSGVAVLSAELDLDKTPSVERGRYCPQAAFGTTSYLVTHADLTSGQIGATRFDRAGKVLQAFDIPGATVKLSYHPPPFRGNGCAPVVFAGGAFITLWVAPNGALSCTRVAENGSLLGVTSVATGLSAIGVESLTSDGTHVLASTTDGKVALIATDCSSVSAPVALPATAGATHYSMGAAFDGTQYWIAYSETLSGTADRFLLQAVSTAGAPSGAPVTVAAAPWVGISNIAEYVPAVQGGIAAGGGKTLLDYSVYLNIVPMPPDLSVSKFYFAELSTTGAVSNVTGSSNVNSPVLAFAGDGFAVYPNGPYSGILKRRNDGTVIGSQYPLPAIVSSVASDGTNLLVVSAGVSNQNTWTSPAQLLDPDLEPIGATAFLQHMSERHTGAMIVSGDQTSLAVWRGPDHGLWGSLLSNDGTVLNQEHLTIQPASSNVNLPNPAVASNGTDFLVGWGAATSTGAQEQARLFSGSSGELIQSVNAAQLVSSLDPSQVYGFEPVAASNGNDYLMVWGYGDIAYQAPNLISSFVVEAARISSTGEPLDDPPLVLQTYSNTDPESVYRYLPELAVTYDGTQYVVVSRVGASVTSDGDPAPPVDLLNPAIKVQRVSAAGDIGTPIETPWRGSPSLSGNPPVITWGQGQGLVTFSSEEKLFAGRLSAALAPLDDPALLVTDQLVWHLDWRSSAAWDGSNYWVSWKDDRRPSVVKDDLYVARVSPAGVVLDPSGVVLSQNSPTTDLHGDVGTAGAMLASGKGHVLAVYTRFDPAPDVFNFTLHGRWLSSASAEGGAGGEAGANDGSGGAIIGSGGLGSGEAGAAGSVGDAGSPGEGGGSGAGHSSGGSSPANGGRGGRGGGASGTGGSGAAHSGGSFGSPSPGSGCSIGGARERPNRSLVWLALLALPLARRGRRRVTESFTSDA